MRYRGAAPRPETAGAMKLIVESFDSSSNENMSSQLFPLTSKPQRAPPRPGRPVALAGP